MLTRALVSALSVLFIAAPAAAAAENSPPSAKSVVTPALSDDADSNDSDRKDHEDKAAPQPDVPSKAEVTAILATALKYEATIKNLDRYETQARAEHRRADLVGSRSAEVTANVVDYVMSAGALGTTERIAVKATSPGRLADTMFTTEQVRVAYEARLNQARKIARKARAIDTRAQGLDQQSAAAGKRADVLLQRLSRQASEAGLGTSTTPGNLPATREQQVAWNKGAVQSWHHLGHRIPGVRPVSADDLLDPSKPPRPLHPLKAADDSVIPGVASAQVKGRPVVVLPSETKLMIDGALSRIGKNYSTDPADGFTCSSLVENIEGSYPLTGSPSDIFAVTQPVPVATRQPGDLIFLAAPGAGVHHVGVYLGDNRMVDASPLRFQVGISQVPTDVYAVTRPSLGPRTSPALSETVENPTMVCNAPIDRSAAGWQMPMHRGDFTLSSTFGESGPMWEAGHTGQDFAAPEGTPIYAADAGTVSLKKVGWAGTLITVAGAGGLTQAYAHTSQQLVEDGDHVDAGQLIALVGSVGNVSGPHLHFEVLRDGTQVDPLPYLLKYLPEAGTSPWGGYGNGQIPPPVLCKLPSGIQLRCDVADDYLGLSEAFKDQFGHRIVVVDGYRDLAHQIQVTDAGTLKNLPGTSPLGWATRISIEPVSSPEQPWLDANAPIYHFTPSDHDLVSDRR